MEPRNPSGLFFSFASLQFHLKLPEALSLFSLAPGLISQIGPLPSFTQNGSVSMKILSTSGGGGTRSASLR